ncbi:hypothetical protein SALBM217S_01781 [Streptomyces griseoloalbus]
MGSAAALTIGLTGSANAALLNPFPYMGQGAPVQETSTSNRCCCKGGPQDCKRPRTGPSSPSAPPAPIRRTAKIVVSSSRCPPQWRRVRSRT